MKYQERTKRRAVIKRGEKKVLSPKEIKVTPEIMCTECKKPSGYENSDLINIKPPRDIKCKNCGKVCIKVRSGFTT